MYRSAIIFLFLFAATLTQAQHKKIKWQAKYGGLKDDYPKSLIKTQDNGYVICGSSASADGSLTGNNGIDDVWLVKTDSIGNMLWQKNYGGSKSDVGSCIIQTADGGYFIAGYTTSNDKDITTNKGIADIWCIKTDSTGNMLWQQTYGGSDDDKAYSCIQTNDGGYLVAGYTNSTDGDATGNTDIMNFWVLKTDGNGSIQWQKSYGGNYVDIAKQIIAGADNSYTVIGYSSSTNGDVTNNKGFTDVWVINLSQNGNLNWQKNYGGSSSDEGKSIIRTDDNGYIFTGSTKSADADVTNNIGGYDLWVVKTNKTGNILWQKTYGGTKDDEGNTITATTDGYVISGGTRSNDNDVSGLHGSGYTDDCWVINISESGVKTWQKVLGTNMVENACAAVINSNGTITLAGQSNGTGGDATSYIGLNDYWLVTLTDSTLHINPTSVNTAANIKAYPAITTGIVYITSSDNIQGTFSLTDISGRLLSSGTFQSHHTIDISNRHSGIYILKINTPGKELIQKIILCSN